jgi:threonine dehydrogenase-like Zn-dependent dehydrogenase
MKALVYEGPRKVTVKEMPDAKIQRPTDVLVKITTTNICGSERACILVMGRRLRKSAGKTDAF